MADANDIPVSLVATGANRHDSAVLDGLLRNRVVPLDFGHVESIKQNLCLDAGCIGKAQLVVSHGITPHIPPRGEEKKAIEQHGFKPKRGIVEAAHSWFNRFRKLLARYEKKYVAYRGLLHLAAAMIIMNKVIKDLSGIMILLY